MEAQNPVEHRPGVYADNGWVVVYERGAQIYDSDFRRALNASDYTTVRVMLDKGENVNGIDHGNQDVTSLHMAVGRADVTMVEMLLHAGANPNAKTTYGLSPIAYIDHVLKANLRSRPFSEHWRKIYALLREHGARDDLSEEVKAALLER